MQGDLLRDNTMQPMIKTRFQQHKYANNSTSL